MPLLRLSADPTTTFGTRFVPIIGPLRFRTVFQSRAGGINREVYYHLQASQPYHQVKNIGNIACIIGFGM
jgi:hypothetical protein